MIGSLDLNKINIHENYEVEYWATQFDINPEVLKEAVAKAGTSPEAVRKFLEN